MKYRITLHIIKNIYIYILLYIYDDLCIMFDALAQLMPHGLLCSCSWPSRGSAVAVISDSRYAIPPGPENCEATGPKYRAAEELNKNRIQ